MSRTTLQAATRGIPTTADAVDGFRDTLAQWGPLLLRLALGWGFIMHGWAKLSRGPEGFAVVLHTLGVPASFLMAWLTTILELAGGLALVAGAFVPLVSVPLAVILLVALVKVHLPYGFFSVKLVEVSAHGTRFGTVGYEIIVMYLGGLAALALGGAGRWSVDHWWNGRRADEDASA
jgi:putative oxidoreductase